MKIRPVGAEVMRTDGPTDRHDEANSRFSQFRKRGLKTLHLHAACLLFFFVTIPTINIDCFPKER